MSDRGVQAASAAHASRSGILVPRTMALLRTWADAGECLGAQLFVSRAGKVVADVAVGRSGPLRDASTDDVGRLYCTVKPLTACCVARAVEAGEASFDDPASRFLPAFRRGPRRAITLRQLLSHSSGLPNLRLGDPYDHEFDELVQMVCAYPLDRGDWYRKPTYNNTHAWAILAAVVERLYAMPLAAVVASVVAAPSGLPGLRMTWPDPGRYVHCYRVSGGSFSILPEPRSAVLFRNVNPAHGGFATVRDLGMFYAELIRCATGHGDLLGEAGIREMTRTQSVVDLSLGLGEIQYGLGFFTNMRDNGTGGQWSRRSFGHVGLIGRHRVVQAFADVDHQAAVAVRLFSVGAKNNWRFHRVCSALWSDLCLDDG
jgi:CubicO group peptidase (beta-lactamase class C family)